MLSAKITDPISCFNQKNTTKLGVTTVDSTNPKSFLLAFVCLVLFSQGENHIPSAMRAETLHASSPTPTLFS